MQGTNSSYFSFSFHEAERKYLTWLWPSPTSDPPLGTLLHVSLLWTASLVQLIHLLLSGKPQVFLSSEGARKACFCPFWGNPCCAPGDTWLPLSFLLHGCCAQPELACDLKAGLGGISHQGGNWEAGR